ncbi:MerR family transcriptional regulator [Streptomyces bohaiensis]|uniref:MerR family transcriptional regulator n=1 Tax=Streptomyces bohaiensis TaxID=1431344 RepID=A0ABX1C9E1_9ACTN|nr:MerR family transcriptional regulator [Streptomyces bohaiensis]NJQ15752.1 MerR family transcriptional regulator [Streptomyces bohaiensis]
MRITSPRQVTIGDAAAFAGTTPRAIRHYHAIGLLPEPARGGDGRRRYGYEDMINLLWIRRMADAGIALDDIRDAFTNGAECPGAESPGEAPTGAAPGSAGPCASPDGTSPDADADTDTDTDSGTHREAVIAGTLERLADALAAQEAELRRQRVAVQRMRAEGSRLGLLSDLVTERLRGAPEGSMRQADLDTLLVTERIFGPLGAAVQAGRFVALARDPALREESDRIDAAEEALDDGVAVDDPRVARVAGERHAFESRLNAAMEAAGQGQEDEALFDAWDAAHPATADAPARREPGAISAAEAVGMMPYDFSPARLRCMELAVELAARESPAA